MDGATLLVLHFDSISAQWEACPLIKYTLSGKAEETVECIKKDLENQLLS